MSSSNRADRPAQSDSVPVIRWDQAAAEDAFFVHRALVEFEQANPQVKDSPSWMIVRTDAFERFFNAFERLS